MWTETDISDDTEIATAEHAPMARINQQIAPREGTALELMVATAQQAITRVPKEMIGAAKQIGGLLGADGFYRFPAGGTTVEGVSIDLAQALAQQWGGIAYQVRILSVEMLAGGGRKVHLRATVTDLKSLVAAEVDQVVTTASPPGKFAAKAEQAERWHAMQTQSAASKIVRNAILRVLPAWYVNAAFAAARAVADSAATGGKTLPEARNAAIGLLSALGFTRAEMEAYTGQPLDLWAAPQLHQLRELHDSVKSARTSIEQVRASLAESSAPAATGKGALGLTPKKPTKGKPDGDDEPPPTGTDGRGRGSAEEGSDDASAAAFEAHRAANGEQASLRIVREDSEEDLIAKAAAWQGHIGAMSDPWKVRGAFRKRAAAFTAEGVHAKREEQTLARITALGESNARAFLYCSTQRERESAQRRNVDHQAA